MKIKTLATILLLVTNLAHPALANETSIEAATSDANLAVEAMIDNQESDLREYIDLFMGHITCSYDFPDEDAFNSIADTSLKVMALNVKTFLSTRDHVYFSSMSEDQKDYVANIITQTVIGKWSTEVSAAIQIEITNNPAYCAEKKASHQETYNQLAEKILGK